MVTGRKYVFDFADRHKNAIRNYKSHEHKSYVNHFMTRLECCKLSKPDKVMIENIKYNLDIRVYTK